MIGRYQCGCVDLVSWFPCVVTVGISLPLDEVLKASFVAIKAVINDGLDLVFLSIFDQLRGWPHVVDPMLRCFTIREWSRLGVRRVDMRQVTPFW